MLSFSQTSPSKGSSAHKENQHRDQNEVKNIVFTPNPIFFFPDDLKLTTTKWKE